MTETEIELLKKQIEIQLEEYQRALGEAVAWHRNWRLNRGFRCVEQSKRMNNGEPA